MRDAWLTVALGCVMAGVLGNLYDRLGLHGEVWPATHPRAGETIYAVRDWILWQANDRWRWPNFNIADSLLVVGAAVLFFHALRQPDQAAKEVADDKRVPRLHSDASSVVRRPSQPLRLFGQRLRAGARSTDRHAFRQRADGDLKAELANSPFDFAQTVVVAGVSPNGDGRPLRIQPLQILPELRIRAQCLDGRFPGR